jgi:hypothetical protein
MALTRVSPQMQSRDFESVTSLLADTVLDYAGTGTDKAVAGKTVVTRTEGFSYTVAASGATDQHVTTAGGVKLYVVSDPNVKAFGAVGDGVVDDTVSIQTALDASEGRTVFFPKGVYNLTSSIYSPANTAEYGLALVGDSSGPTVLAFDMASGDGFYLSHRPADPVNYGDPASYTGGLIQRNVRIESLTFKNVQGTPATPGTRTGSGLMIYFSSMVTIQNVICQGWSRGLDLWCWASTVQNVRARECDAGFYYWSGTCTNFINTYAGSCQYGYLIGGEPNTTVGSNTNTPGLQNPYPPVKPVSIVFSGTAADASSLWAYCINDCFNVSFETPSSEGTGKGMFLVYKTSGRVTIRNANHTKIYTGFTSAECFLFTGNAYTNVKVSDTKLDGPYTVAVFQTNAVYPYLSNSVVYLDNFVDLTTGVGSKVYQAVTYMDNTPTRSVGNTGTVVFSAIDFGWQNGNYNAMTFEVVGTARAGGASDLIGFSCNVTLAGTRAGSYTIYTSNIAKGTLYGGGISAFNITATMSASFVVTLTLTGTFGGAAAAWDGGNTRAGISSNTKFTD